MSEKEKHLIRDCRDSLALCRVSKASLKDQGQGRHSFGSSQSEADLASQVALLQSALSTKLDASGVVQNRAN